MHKISVDDVYIDGDIESQQNIVPMNVRTYCEIIALFWVMVFVMCITTIFVFLVIKRLSI
jgi:hypothetical protein